jgi:cytochrome c biogenesis protein ResB
VKVSLRALLAGPFSFLASLKTAIPLLVVTVVATIAGSLQPDTDYYRSAWYLGLLGLNGVSLLFVTIQHTPAILVKKGRNALIGVVATHLGILILIGGAIYGGVVGERYVIKAIEGEMMVVPGLPFVIHLDELIIEEYPPDAFAHMNLEMLPKKRQESRLTLYRGGEPWRELTAGPGFPAKAGGFTILPSISDTGWYFELKVTDPMGRDSFVPVRPWAPPLVHVGETDVMAHSLMEAGVLSAQVFTVQDGEMILLGTLTSDTSLSIGRYTLALHAFRRYTGLSIYNRPHAPLLVAGSLAMLFGLVWHFYFRHRDRRRRSLGGTADA